MRALGILGASGRIGSLLGELCQQQGIDGLAVGRQVDEVGLSTPRSGAGIPLVVCTRNDDLPEIIEVVHPTRRQDLVFVQNGMVQPWLEARGLGDCTQGVLYVAVPKVGATPVGGGTSVFHGPWAGEVAGLLAKGGIAAEAVSSEVYAREVAVKLAWICVFGLLGQATKTKVGVVATRYAGDVAALTAELHPVLVTNPGLDLDAAALSGRLLEYGLSIPDFPSSLKEWGWRNGWLLDEARRQGVALPLHQAWLTRAGGAPGG